MRAHKRRKARFDVAAMPPYIQEQLKAQGVDVSATKSEGETRANKFNVGPKENRTVDGIKFASVFEATCYKWLCQILGPPPNFKIQVPYILHDAFVDENGKKIRPIKYIADFDLEVDGKTVTVDTKGVLTPAFKDKAKLFAKRYGRSIRIIKTKRELIELIHAGKH